MAGDWIKIRHSLTDDPDVMKLSDICRTGDCQTVGMLVKFWTWADRHSVDGTGLAITAERIDKLVDHLGFAAALRQIGWLDGRDGSLQIPNFERHNGMSAKARELEREAKRIRRTIVGHTSDVCRTKSIKNVGLEKRREEKNINTNTGGKPRFAKPTLEEITQYCLERGNGISAQDFLDYYESSGWVVGKSRKPMKDWQAAVRTWESNRREKTKPPSRVPTDEDLKNWNPHAPLE